MFFLVLIIRLKLLAKKEEREIRGLVAKVVEYELTKLELKLKHVSEIENNLDRERIQVCVVTPLITIGANPFQVEKLRQGLYQEKLQLTQAKLRVIAATQNAQNRIAQPGAASSPQLSSSPIIPPATLSNSPVLLSPTISRPSTASPLLQPTSGSTAPTTPIPTASSPSVPAPAPLATPSQGAASGTQVPAASPPAPGPSVSSPNNIVL